MGELAYFVCGIGVFVVGNLIISGIKGHEKVTQETFQVFCESIEKRFDALDKRLSAIEHRIARVEEFLLK